MSGSYKATGINLKGVPMGESDRLLTVLTREQGLVRAVAPGSRKHESSLRGRSGLFVVNELLLVKGRGLDKIIQAESLESFPGLSQDLRKLTAAQYLAELALYQALSEQPQDDLFQALRMGLGRLEQAPEEQILLLLVQGILQMLYLAGVTPEVQICAVTRQPLPEMVPHGHWRAGFHPAAGGVVQLAIFEKICTQEKQGTSVGGDAAFSDRGSGVEQQKDPTETLTPKAIPSGSESLRIEEKLVRQSVGTYRSRLPVVGTRLTLDQLDLLRQIATPRPAAMDLLDLTTALSYSSETWLALERALRYYAQYHFERVIQSANLIDVCFAPLPSTVLPYA